ncbi:ROK family protein [Rathayibacter sp. VKM Ac-2760]|uniref:ROK family protein n=1 Tax=Rathayibacter sp. VKM Ac-2760 TaxID=2609253 RepID=UPI001317B8CB|nr:ROK family protein [Rathayibacter sp. VKM Ac-2760]QHC61034.1 ROK family protein [Rathayibacter sp. VKM Ac-2760]
MRVGIDIGGTKTHAILLEDGEIVDELVAVSGRGEEGVVRGTLDVLRALSLRRGRTLDASVFESVGIGIPGTVDVENGVVTHAVNLGIRGGGLALRRMLQESVGIRASLDNDVKATALGAASTLGLLDHHDVTYLNVGTGVAAATTLDGVILRGVGGMAGEIGHLSVDPQGEHCICGQTGCLETVLGGGGIERRLREVHEDLTPTDLFLDRPDVPGLTVERDRIVGALAHACTLLATTYGADTIVLGGGVIRHVDGLVEATVALLERRAEQSSFLAALAVAERLVTVPTGLPIAALGAAVLGIPVGERHLTALPGVQSGSRR